MDPEKLKKLLGEIEGLTDLWDAKSQWAELITMSMWLESNKQLIGKAINLYEKKWDDDRYYGGIMEGLALAAYILSWDDLLERHQSKDACLRFNELNNWLKEQR